MTAVGRRWMALLLIVAGASAAFLFAAATAFARDARVRSFDDTRVLVHFFPAAGLKPHHRAPC